AGRAGPGIPVLHPYSISLHRRFGTIGSPQLRCKDPGRIAPPSARAGSSNLGPLPHHRCITLQPHTPAPTDHIYPRRIRSYSRSAARSSDVLLSSAVRSLSRRPWFRSDHRHPAFVVPRPIASPVHPDRLPRPPPPCPGCFRSTPADSPILKVGSSRSP